MKNEHRITLKNTALLLAFIFLGSQQRDCAQPLAERIKTAQSEGSLSGLSATLEDIEALWPKDPRNYFKLQGELGKALEPLAETNSAAKEELNKQTKLTIAKKCPTNPDDASTCFKSKTGIVETKVRLSASAPNVPDAQLLAKLMGEIRASMIPGYKRALVTVNVMPPTGSGFRVAGMDPNAITDPKAKADYLKAIEENNLRNSTNNLQLYTLPESYNRLKKHFFGYVRKLIATDPAGTQQLENLVTTARLTEEERSELRQQLAK